MHPGMMGGIGMADLAKDPAAYIEDGGYGNKPYNRNSTHVAIAMFIRSNKVRHISMEAIEAEAGK